MAGEENDALTGGAASDFLRQLEAVLARHGVVRQDDIEALGSEEFERMSGIEGGGDLIAHGGERVSERGPQLEAVLDQKDAGAACWGGGFHEARGKEQIACCGASGESHLRFNLRESAEALAAPRADDAASPPVATRRRWLSIRSTAELGAGRLREWQKISPGFG